MTAPTLFVLASFWILFGLRHREAKARQELWQKPRGAWILDLTGLAIQGGLVPLGQVYLAHHVLPGFFPGQGQSLELGALASFLLSFAGVDYLYYWNHRALHSDQLWPWHQVHHGVDRFDVFVTSRNSALSSGLILYLWVHPLALFALKDPTGYLLGIAATSALDLWRHSGLDLTEGRLRRVLGALLILPADHATHHGATGHAANFGANFKLWDRLHGTYQEPAATPPPLGPPLALSWTRQLFWPFPEREVSP